TVLASTSDLSPQPLYEMALGFASTKVLLAAHRLGLFETLHAGPQSAETIARKHGYASAATETLLNAAVSLGLCTKSGDLFSNASLSERFLVSGQRGYLGRFLDHFNDHMYPVWFALEEGVRTGHSQVQRVMGDQTDHFFQAIDRQSKDLKTFMET